ncbi:hypothetical protein D3C87_1497560 [compost metagenome]
MRVAQRESALRVHAALREVEGFFHFGRHGVTPRPQPAERTDIARDQAADLRQAADGQRIVRGLEQLACGAQRVGPAQQRLFEIDGRRAGLDGHPHYAQRPHQGGVLAREGQGVGGCAINLPDDRVASRRSDGAQGREGQAGHGKQ